ncbi:TPA: phage protein NinX family protein [Morganella morganii]
MMQYKEVTDYEINKTVAKYLKLNTIAYDRTEIVLFDDIDATPFDPCNNPADAMPIIIENGISLISDWNEIGVWGATYQPWWTSENKNPYRAAMEVFLMMKNG